MPTPEIAMSRMKRRGALLLALGAIGPAGPAAASAFPARPQGRVVLSVSGQVRVTNDENAASFDLSMLESLGLDGFDTATPWHPARARFEGVPMLRLMQAVGAWGEQVRAVALNDYQVDIPFEHFARHDMLIATRRDGIHLPVREQGPLFLLYPFDNDPRLRDGTFYRRAVWYLRTLVVF